MTDEDIERERKAYAALEHLRAIETPKLPPHDPEAPCPKCGADAQRIPVEFHTIAPDRFFGRYALVENPKPCAGKYLGEHLCRTCGRCGYSWQERTVG